MVLAVGEVRTNVVVGRSHVHDDRVLTGFQSLKVAGLADILADPNAVVVVAMMGKGWRG